MEINLLIVGIEQEPEWNDISNYLKRKKIFVQTVDTPAEAFKTVKNEPVNIILSNYTSKNTNTSKFIKKIKSLKPHVEIIYLSKNVPLPKAIEALREGAYDFHEFPINKKLLFTVIEKAIEKQTLFVEKKDLETKFKEKFDFESIIGRSKEMQSILDIVASISRKEVNILITGETGTGKEMIANAIHYNSHRSSKPFIKVNCAAFNEGILESELFGHEKGAFTGAYSKRIGRFELANGGTLFFDEIGDISVSTQVKLLRILQEKEFERVGGSKTLKTDVRVIAATHQDLKKMIGEGRFRSDLYYRLNVVHIDIPPLRDRKGDMPYFVNSFIHKLNKEKNYKIKGISKEAMQILLKYQWPGNVRELENAIESAMALTTADTIEAKFLPTFLFLTQALDDNYYHISQNLTFAEIEEEIIRLALGKTGGNKTLASKLLGIGLRTIQRKAKKN